jgi:AcrR family transcriptional regulator
MLDTPKRDRQAERREATRQEILDAAWAIAREGGLAEVTLRGVAERVGMRAPSLYFHFDSKNAIYDAMFGQAWSACYAAMTELRGRLAKEPRAAIKQIASAFFDFAVSDLARHQLMNQRTIPNFEPSPEAYAPSVKVLSDFRAVMADLGVRDDAAIDINTALIGGLIDAQLANDPGGDRWAKLLDRALDMYCDHLGIPPATPRTTPSATPRTRRRTR